MPKFHHFSFFFTLFTKLIEGEIEYLHLLSLVMLGLPDTTWPYNSDYCYFMRDQGYQDLDFEQNQ